MMKSFHISEGRGQFVIGKRISNEQAVVLYSTIPAYSTGTLLRLEKDKYKWWILKRPKILEELPIIEKVDVLHLTKQAILIYDMFNE